MIPRPIVFPRYTCGALKGGPLSETNERIESMRAWNGLLLTLGIVICSAAGSTELEEATAEKYSAEAGSKGLVLFDIYWNRVWKCGGFQNAQLRSLGFDRTPLKSDAADSPGLLMLTNPSELAPPRNFVQYAMLLEPGEYQLTSFAVKVAKSTTDVGTLTATRAQLVQDGASKAGSFTVAAGEVVFIGNFAIDCLQQPIPWRYFTEGKKNFEEHLQQYQRKFPFIDPSKVVYRLFSTTTFGEPYELK